MVGNMKTGLPLTLGKKVEHRFLMDCVCYVNSKESVNIISAVVNDDNKTKIILSFDDKLKGNISASSFKVNHKTTTGGNFNNNVITNVLFDSTKIFINC